jgi:hypothetical protein
MLLMTNFFLESWVNRGVQALKNITLEASNQCFPCQRGCSPYFLVVIVNVLFFLALCISATHTQSALSLRKLSRANRPKSYISRTIGWDQYPHGRWGDSRNPSYGALTDYQVISYLLVQVNNDDVLNNWVRSENFVQRLRVAYKIFIIL